MALDMEVGLSPGDFGLDGSPAPPLKGAEPHAHFLAHFYCGQTDEMPLGTEVGLSPGDFVSDGDPAPPQKGSGPNFRLIFIVAKRLDGSR